MTNCKNCGAPITPEKVCCEYCGTVNDAFVSHEYYDDILRRARDEAHAVLLPRIVIDPPNFGNLGKIIEERIKERGKNERLLYGCGN